MNLFLAISCIFAGAILWVIADAFQASAERDKLRRLFRNLTGGGLTGIEVSRITGIGRGRVYVRLSELVEECAIEMIRAKDPCSGLLVWRYHSIKESEVVE